ncbi:hypothetical protein K503DRAFT_869933 [Rhizopogon vinicolor AM-OR11-026]|uniref:CBM21 domain-containing protein n=1 Tax=Rhizopogon vinicolor AM-OR11-026 TaxID=1314800 RepID=A0A1B7MJS2_9AGAM|nr:hypothetical protein K503DRAFT_869933 [Rhizopogon vinicolor AM-OR11-026]
MSSMACETSQFHIPFPSTSPEILLDGNDAELQMLQRLSRLPYVPLSESTIAKLLDNSALEHDMGHLGDESSIRFPVTDIYHYDSSSSNSSTSSAPSDESHIIIPRARRVRGQNSATASVSHPLSPTLSSINSRNNLRVRGQADIIKDGQRTLELNDTSDADTVRPLQGSPQAPSGIAGSAKSTLLGAHPRQLSSEMRASSLPHLDSHLHGAQSGNLNISPQMRFIRKKSGEPVKPSLKRPKVPSLLIPTTGVGVVKSEPTTPTLSKAVHFDPKLEHVKLFLAKQKPLAVSRDHDPTDTSGTESDFPSFVRGPPDGGPEKQIELQIWNMPSVSPEDADVILHGLTLSQSDKTIIGTVRVRNIAYEKWVAARFTLDLWQTTSEVTARYTESVDGGAFDIFTFSIRLHDMWPRIEGKTMFIALRYSAAGRHFWDNNNGANYMVKFVPILAARKASPATELIMEGSSVKLDLARVDVDPPQASRSPRSAPTFTPDASLSAKYHRGFASKIPGSGTLRPLSPPGTRTPTYPSELPSVLLKHAPYRVEQIPSRHSRSVTLGSPRELEGRESHIVRSSSAELEFPLSQSRAGRERNHRRGYFDRPVSGTLRKTPPGSPLSSLPEERSPTRGSDLIPSLFERFTAQSVARVSSESSDSTAMSNSSSRSSPLTSSGPDTPDSDDKPSLNDSYSQFLNQFCFFTGSNILMSDHSPGSITRSQSASEIEAFLRSHSPLRYSPPPLRTPALNEHRSYSLDNIAASHHTQRGKSMLASAA